MFLFKTILNLKISNNLSRGASRSSDSRAGEGHSPETKHLIFLVFTIIYLGSRKPQVPVQVAVQAWPLHAVPHLSWLEI